MGFDRRSVLKGTGAAIGASLFSTTGAAAGRAIDDRIDLLSDELQESLLVLEPGADTGFLDGFDLPDGRYEMEALDIVYTRATGPEIKNIAGRNEVQFVEANRELSYDNGDGQTATKARTAHEDLGYTGSGVHVAVIDSGLDGYHPDLRPRIKNHYQYVNPLEQGITFAPVPGPADTDDIGHGTHCAGTVLGEGNVNEEYEGMAPGADLTLYSVGVGLSILAPVAAFNHLISEVHPDQPVQLTSNSYGSAGGTDFNPSGTQERATWRAFQEGILSCSSAGNSGPGTNTLGGAKTAPHILSVAASHDGQGSDGVSATKRPTEFSSRGRAADYEEGEGARWDEFPASGGGYTAEDRKTAIENLRAFNSDAAGDREVFNEFEKSASVGPGVSDPTGLVGDLPGPLSGSSSFIKYEPVEKAKNVRATLSWIDGVQDIDLYLREGAEDGPVIASSTAGQTTSPSPGGGELETVVTSVDPETTYYFEIRPWAAVQAQCTLSVAERGAAPETDLPGDPSGPFGVYRPSVIAPGNAVISTQGVSAIKALSAQGNPQAALQRPLYASSSGTSMSCPAVAGISALVMQAWYENNGEEYPSPEQVIRIIEGTAEENAEEVYTPYNVGAGFVNAKKAVETAIAGEVPGYTDIRLPENEKGDAAE